MKPIVFDLFFETSEKMTLLNERIVQKIEANLGLTFLDDKEIQNNVCFANRNEVRWEFKEIFTQKDLLNYNYALLFSSDYREKNIKFLKVSIESVVLSARKEEFWKLVLLGKELRCVHSSVEDNRQHNCTNFPESGENLVDKIKFTIHNFSPEKEKYTVENYVNSTEGRLYINENQYFDNVPKMIWDFRIGKVKPAQNWLKSYTGKQLSVEDVLAFQKIISVLTATVSLIRLIDEIEV